ncbi:ATP-dependent RecD-like DNA helicase [Wenyingzhuangia sp. 2_MG-2023]|uniref:ATP-dependent DNA helicase n=1 Tax=Wenyingzhuangia sp. 2_MG-2023 TaxID=3062639 RepID=UPI0026E2CBE1|nr:AAA family ATPase [Wenyingzhuangia sp. 2_MG-2023]MDO6738927.1 AAA family ATPase [Wenyingzhuangia sp. 2_MG-2023]
MIKSASEFYKKLHQKFPFEPTQVQEELLRQLSEFSFDTDDDAIFILKGYAGTGKTTSMSTFVNHLWEVGKKAVLLAPTGRAAKVISNYSKKKAYTIHKKIYHPKKQSNGNVAFVKQPNKHINTFFIVDESSMIADGSGDVTLFDKNSLLDDLMEYVYNGLNCKLIFIGDTAQLPPVKSELSPALSVDTLAINYQKNPYLLELDQVMRQHEGSGILSNATELRAQLERDGFYDFQFDVNFPDIVRLQDGYDIEEAITNAYDRAGIEDTAFIVRSNKRANQYNQQIRTKIGGQENEISAGDYVMIVKNNYFWLKDTTEADFIANGDIAEVQEIYNIKELYGFRFAEVRLRLIDYVDLKPIDTVLLLDTVTSESPSLTYEESNRLYQEVLQDYADEKSKYKQMLSVKNNHYFNALQIKFAYAMTCHKSQGGQWNTIFIEQPYMPEGLNKDSMRWLYTAITRAKEKVYLIGFGNEYFNEN